MNGVNEEALTREELHSRKGEERLGGGGGVFLRGGGNRSAGVARRCSDSTLLVRVGVEGVPVQYLLICGAFLRDVTVPSASRAAPRGLRNPQV